MDTIAVNSVDNVMMITVFVCVCLCRYECPSPQLTASTPHQSGSFSWASGKWALKAASTLWSVCHQVFIFSLCSATESEEESLEKVKVQ